MKRKCNSSTMDFIYFLDLRDLAECLPDFFSSGPDLSSDLFRPVDKRASLVIGAITVPIFVRTFGAVSLRTADSGTNVDVTGARIVDSNAAAERNGNGKSLTCSSNIVEADQPSQ